ncbi:hypothetical protein LTR53_003428 [Teratosphaeriaceae sp. CCFEE 6253]|nr:hypothetical protein LTR53_003428 [Teratosphaeriaceae sp. CCFEE 6253]
MPQTPASAGGTSSRARASKACARCNQKRVKCDALAVGQPCSRCKRSGITQCVLISSRRGQYPRKRAASTNSATSATNDVAVASPLAEEPQGAGFPVVHPRSPEIRRQSQVRPASSRRRETVGEEPQSTLDPTPKSHTTGDSGSTPYKEVSWAAMFNHFLDTRQAHRADAIDKTSITYLGESFPLALILEDLREDGRTRIHHAGPPLEDPDDGEHSGDATGHPSHLLPEDLRFLEAKHAFDRPARDVFDAMIDVFLNRYMPLYTLVNRQEFQEQHREDKLPWIMVHACCFIATTFCADELVHRAGFTSRKEARCSYYTKAKVLFDAGYERDKIVVLQITTMLTFWGGGPNDYWNTWSWTSTAVTLAETLGIHRSTAGTNMSHKDRSLFKRLWWTLVIRDASCSTLLGRPFRINMEHSDAEMLTLQDFEYDSQSLGEAGHPLGRTFAHYQIQGAKLSLLLYDIDYARFIPGPKALTMDLVYDRLQAWKNALPPEVNWEHDPTGANLLATALSMILGISGSEVAAGATDTTMGSESNLVGMQQPFAELAAQRVSTQASAIVMKSQALLVPHETYQSVFLAGVVSYTSMRSSQTMLAQVGRLVVDNCRMVLHNVREAYDAAPWVITLFDGLTNKLNTLPRLDSSSGDQQAAFMAGGTPGFNFGAMAEIEDGLMGYDMPASWHSNPMLSALFDTSQPMDGF